MPTPTDASQARIVITGVGVVSPNGVGATAFNNACMNGRSGITAITQFDTSTIKSRYAGTVTEFDAAEHVSTADLRRVPRMVPFAVAASREAMRMANLIVHDDDIALQRRIGVSLGTGGGGLEFVEEQYRRIYQGGKRSPFAITAGTHGNLSSELSIQLKLRGPSHVVSTGCASSTDALGHAMMVLRSGAVDVMIAGGADATIAPGILGGFEMLGVISTRTFDQPEISSRPFNIDRDGFILGEGAWMFVVETLANATRRGATVLAELAGYASTCDAFHRVQIAPDLEECTRAIAEALIDAQVSAEQIDYVNLHGTGTQLNDRLETAAIKRALGEAHARRTPMSATKSLIGHPQGASGAAGIAATVLMMQSGTLHPTINITQPDPACDLDYVPVSRKHSIKAALCNCIAFGSKNSALVLVSAK